MRMGAVPLFPSRDSRVRLAWHALIGQRSEWTAAERRYVSLSGMARLKRGIAGPSCPRLSEENPNPLGRRRHAAGAHPSN
jgi:hypothetical protein